MKIDLSMAWRNIWRNKRRSFLTIAAITFACGVLIFMLSLQLGSYKTMILSSVNAHTSHLQVQAEGYQDKQEMRAVIVNPGQVKEYIRQTEIAEAAAARAQGFSLASSKDRSYGILVMGIEPEAEARVTTLEDVIEKGSYLESTDQNQALVGAPLARNLKIGVGDELVILGSGRDGSVAATILIVKGIFRTGQPDFDRNIVFTPLSYFQDVYNMRGAAHVVAVRTGNIWHTDDLAKAISPKLASMNNGGKPLVALTWVDLLPGLLQLIELDLSGGILMYIFLILVVAFSILNTFLMAILERTREFGIMMAIGTTPQRLVRLLMMESATLTFVGVVAGIVVGSLITYYFQLHGIDFGAEEMMEQFGISSRIHPSLNLISATAGPILIFVITCLAALYPALKVTRLKPVEAIRTL